MNLGSTGEIVSVFLLYGEAPSWTEYFAGREKVGRIVSLDLLAIFMVTEPRIQLAFCFKDTPLMHLVCS